MACTFFDYFDEVCYCRYDRKMSFWRTLQLKALRESNMIRTWDLLNTQYTITLEEAKEV